MKRPLLPPDAILTFADYFRLPADTATVLPQLGFQFEARPYELPRTKRSLDGVPALRERIERTLPLVSLSSETARREFLIAPVLVEVLQYTGGRLRVEFPIEVSSQLQGTLDYFLQVRTAMIVVEAKNADLDKGFTQLAVELIALDQWVDVPQPLLYGAVSMGEIWRFAILDRAAKRVTQDLRLYRVPEDIESLVRILVGILE